MKIHHVSWRALFAACSLVCHILIILINNSVSSQIIMKHSSKSLYSLHCTLCLSTQLVSSPLSRPSPPIRAVPSTTILNNHSFQIVCQGYLFSFLYISNLFFICPFFPVLLNTTSFTTPSSQLPTFHSSPLQHFHHILSSHILCS